MQMQSLVSTPTNWRHLTGESREGLGARTCTASSHVAKKKAAQSCLKVLVQLTSGAVRPQHPFSPSPLPTINCWPANNELLVIMTDGVSNHIVTAQIQSTPVQQRQSRQRHPRRASKGLWRRGPHGSRCKCPC